MPAEKEAETVAVPEHLFHTLLNITDRAKDPTGANHAVYVLESYGTLKAAKAHAKAQSMSELRLGQHDFQEYAVQPTNQLEAEDWPHGDGVLVYARGQAGTEVRVVIHTTPNNESLPAMANGKLLLPDGAKFLHYVLQSSIDYNLDRSGCVQTIQSVSAYAHRQDAWAAARKVLDPDQFAEFDDRNDEQFTGQWPYGEDVAIHAVSETGQNFYVAVQLPLWAHEGRKHRVKRDLATA